MAAVKSSSQLTRSGLPCPLAAAGAETMAAGVRAVARGPPSLRAAPAAAAAATAAGPRLLPLPFRPPSLASGLAAHPAAGSAWLHPAGLCPRAALQGVQRPAQMCPRLRRMSPLLGGPGCLCPPRWSNPGPAACLLAGWLRSGAAAGGQRARHWATCTHPLRPPPDLHARARVCVSAQEAHSKGCACVPGHTTLCASSVAGTHTHTQANTMS